MAQLSQVPPPPLAAVLANVGSLVGTHRAMLLGRRVIAWLPRAGAAASHSAPAAARSTGRLGKAGLAVVAVPVAVGAAAYVVETARAPDSVAGSGSGSVLPMEYDVTAIEGYWTRR